MLYAIVINYAYIEHRYNDDYVVLVKEGNYLLDIFKTLDKVFDIQEVNDCMHYPLHYFADNLSQHFRVPNFKKNEDELIRIDSEGVFYIREKQKIKYAGSVEEYAVIDDQSFSFHVMPIPKYNNQIETIYDRHVLTAIECERLNTEEFLDEDYIEQYIDLDQDDLYHILNRLSKVTTDKLILETEVDSFLLDLTI